MRALFVGALVLFTPALVSGCILSESSERCGADPKTHACRELAAPSDAGDASVELGTRRTYTSRDLPVSIPDDEWSGASATIIVPEGGVVRALRVSVRVRHSYPSDLTGELHHGERRVRLWQGQNAEEYETEVPLFVGDPAGGTWILVVRDTVSVDTGSITSYSLDITT